MTPQEKIEALMKAEQSRFSGSLGLAFQEADGPFGYRQEADREYSTASVIKLFILAALLRRCERGQSSLEDRLSTRNPEGVSGTGVLKALIHPETLSAGNMAVLMIIQSDNVATNALIDYLGLDGIARELREMGLVKTVLNRRLTANAGRDSVPLGISTPAETAGFLYDVVKGKCFGPEHTRFFLNTLGKQQHLDLFVRHMPLTAYTGKDEAGSVKAACKTGAVLGVRNDAGYLFYGGKTYIYAAYTKECKDLAFCVDNEAALFLARTGRIFFEHAMMYCSTN